MMLAPLFLGLALAAPTLAMPMLAAPTLALPTLAMPMLAAPMLARQDANPPAATPEDEDAPDATGEEEVFEDELAPAADTPDGRLAQARTDIAEGRLQPALESLRALLNAHEGDEREVRLALADAQLAAGVPERALDTLKALVEAGDAEALRRAGQAFELQGDRFSAQGRRSDDVGFAYEQAQAHFQRAIDAGDERSLLLAGYLELYKQGDYPAARLRAEALLGRQPGDGEGLLLRGCAGLYDVLAKSGDEAAAARRAAIDDCVAADKALGGRRAEPWVQLAWLYEADGQAGKAVEAAAKVVAISGNVDFTTLYHLAMRYSGERQWDPASRALLAMVKADPKLLSDWIGAEADPTAAAMQLSWSVAALVDSQRLGDARDVLAALCASGPKSADLYNNWGLFARDTRKYEDAYQAYSRALELSPDDPALLNDCAVVLHYYLHRDYGKAQELYAAAVEKADELLASGTLPDDRRASVETARKDAGNNLKKLARGDYEWNG